MKPFTSISILIFISISVFGFLAMNHKDDHSGCIAALIQKIGCLEKNDFFAFWLSHLDAFKKFSTAVFSSSFSLLLSAFLIIFVFLVIDKICGLEFKFSSLNPAVLKPEPAYYRKIIFGRWLSFHENSPTIL